MTLVSYAAYTAKTCPFTAQPDGCECTGNNDALGDAGRHYSSSCPLNIPVKASQILFTYCFPGSYLLLFLTQLVVTDCELLRYEDCILASQSCKCYGNLSSKVE